MRMNFSTICLFTATLILLRILRTIYIALIDPLRDIPGPFLARFTRLWYFKSVIEGDFHHKNLELHRKYAAPGEHHARIVRIGPNLYSIASPEKVLYGITSKLPKGTWYKGWIFPNAGPTLFQERDFQKHADHRRGVSSLYSVTNLVTYEPRMEDSLELFKTRLSQFADEDRSFNMAEWLQFWAFDTIVDLTYSNPIGFMKKGLDVDNICAAVDQANVYSTLVGIYDWVHPTLFRILNSLPASGESGVSRIFTLAANAIQQRDAERQALLKADQGRVKEAGKPTIAKDFLDKLMEVGKGKGESVGHANETVMAMSLQNLFAGSDTTAVSSAAVIFYLTQNPNCLRLLREEVAACTKTGQIKYKDAQNLPYLQACIKEGLRLHSATGLPLWKTISESGATIYGRRFPPNVEVGINVWVAHYDKDIWGADVEEFRPERWIESKGTDKQRQMESYYMPFGLGARTCIGKNISLMEISKLIPRLIMNFDFELKQQQKHLISKNVWFVKPQDFNVKVHHRKV